MEKQIREAILPLVDDFIKQLNQAIEKQDRKQINFYWIELTVWMVLAAFATRVISSRVKLLFDLGYQGCYLSCKGCGGRMKLQRYRPGLVITNFGPLSFERAYYYCHRGSAPPDDHLRLGSREFSPRLQRIIGFESAHLSFEVVEKSIKESFELEISSEAIRQVSEELGQRARDWEEEQAGIYNEEPLAVEPALERPG